jgi:hypothetical protein
MKKTYLSRSHIFDFIRIIPSPQFSTNTRKRSKKLRRAKKSNKKMLLEENKPEQCERLEKRRSRFTHEPISTVIKPVNYSFFLLIKIIYI